MQLFSYLTENDIATAHKTKMLKNIRYLLLLSSQMMYPAGKC